MKIENDLRTMASFLQAQLKDVETLIAQEKEDKAQEALNFTQGGLKNFANEIEKVDGGFYGLVGILFRRAYHVPDDIKKLREALFQEAERLQKLLDKGHMPIHPFSTPDDLIFPLALPPIVQIE